MISEAAIVWFIVIPGSVVLHELGHVIIGKVCGFKFHGIKTNKKWLGVGVAFEGEKSNLWKVALAGPVINLMLAIAFMPFLPSYISIFGFSMNTLMFLVNMLPFKPADGSFIWRPNLTLGGDSS